MSTSPVAADRIHPETAAPPGLGRVFAVVAGGVAMSNLDLFIVNVALPRIGADLAGTLSSLSWVLNAYAVVFAALLVPAGNLADRTGPRRAYLAGVALFTAASVLCAVTFDVWSLVAARILQAAGAAMLIPSSLGLLLAAAPPERRMAAVRGWTAISGVAAAIGPVAGGLLTQIDWRLVFLVNAPIGVAILVAGRRALPRTPVRLDAGRADLLGAAVLTAAIAAVALGLVESNDWGWRSPAFAGCLVASALLTIGFVRRSASHPSPILPLRLFRAPTFGPATTASLLFSVAFAAMLLSIVLWCQYAWRWRPLWTGLAVAPGPLMVPPLAMGAGPLARRIGGRPIAVAGCLFFLGGIAWWYGRIDQGYLAGMLPGMLLTGVGVGLTLPTLVGAAVSAVPPQSFSTGSAVVTMARQIGSVLGIAMLVAALGAEARSGAAQAFENGWLLTMAATAASAAACLRIRRAPTSRPEGTTMRS